MPQHHAPTPASASNGHERKSMRNQLQSFLQNQLDHGQHGKHEDKNDVEDSFLLFYVGQTKMAVYLDELDEIILYDNVVKIPGTPDFLAGVTSSRGKAVPVVDLGVKFGWPARQTTKKTCIFICQLNANDTPFTVGFVIDSVVSLSEIARKKIYNAPSFYAGIDAQYLRDLIEIEGKLVPVIDLLHVVDATGLVNSSSLEILGNTTQQAAPAPAKEAKEAKEHKEPEAKAPSAMPPPDSVDDAAAALGFEIFE